MVKLDPSAPVTNKSLEQAVDHIVEVLGGRFDDMEGRQDTMEGKLDKMEGRLYRIEIDLTEIKQDIKDIKEDLSDTPTRKEMHQAIRKN